MNTVESFIPDDQQPKLAAIRQLATVLDPVLRPDPNKKPPTDADNVAALKACGRRLKQRPARKPGSAPTPPSGWRTISRSSPTAMRRCGSERTPP